MFRVASTSSLSLNNSFTGIGSVYVNIWKTVTTLASDPDVDVSKMAQTIASCVKKSLRQSEQNISARLAPSVSEPSSPSQGQFSMSGSPSTNYENDHQGRPSSNPRSERPNSESESTGRNTSSSNGPSHIFTPYTRKRTIFGREPSISEEDRQSVEEPSQSTRPPIVTTEFVDWCAKYFCNVSYSSNSSDTESEAYQQREWRISRNLKLKDSVQDEVKRIGDASRIEERLFQQRNTNSPLKTAFHPYESQLYVAEKDTYSVWGLDSSLSDRYNSGYPTLLSNNSNLNSIGSRITSMQLINPHDNSLLMLGSDDGAVKVWSACDRAKPKLVTAFHIFSEMQPNIKNTGLLLHWNQESCQLAAGGEPKAIKIWDARSERKTQEININVDGGITALCGDEMHLICAGCKDGTVRVFDKRIHESKIMTFREHGSNIVHAHIFSENDKHVSVISGSSNGEIRFWDKRILSSIKNMQISQTLTAMSVHSAADVFAWYVSQCN